MKGDFNLALAISLCIHIIVLNGLSRFPILPFKKVETKIPKTEFIEIRREKENTSLKKNFASPPPYLDLKKDNSPLKKIKTFQPEKILKPDSAFLNPKELILTKAKEKLDSYPPYMNYYEKIRERIKETAYQLFSLNSSGKVFINFTINSSGNLISLSVDEKNSDAPEALKKLARLSIEKSAPFPKFPEELSKFETLNFNISIQFKTN